MQTDRLRLFDLLHRRNLVVCGIILLLSACAGSDTETVENRDAEGNLERFERRKKDFAKQGRYQRFLSDGTLAEEAVYRNDSLDGERKLFYPNGKTEIVEHYRRGTMHGEYRKFDENGALLFEQPFVDGRLEGQSVAYYPNGRVKEKVMFRDSEENGPFSQYYENGNLQWEGTFVPGDGEPLEQGELKEYDSTGTLIRIADCQRGICTTRWRKE